MKRIFTFSTLLILSAAFLAGCTKRGYSYEEEDYWLSKERGVVVYSDAYCPYFVVETSYGYTVAESLSGYTPYEGSVIYGDLSRTGYTNFYNRSTRTVFSVDIFDYWLNYYEAQYLIDDLCYYNKGTKTIQKQGEGNPGTKKPAQLK